MNLFIFWSLVLLYQVKTGIEMIVAADWLITLSLCLICAVEHFLLNCPVVVNGNFSLFHCCFQ